MLLSFLESGNSLSLLSRAQMRRLEEAFTLYLIKVIDFNTTLKICYKILDDDQEQLKFLIKGRLHDLIHDGDCNVVYKPAILRLAAGDPSVFKASKISTKSTLRIIDRNIKLIRPQLRRIKFPIKILGSRHIDQLFKENEKTVEDHAKRFVHKYTRYLWKGDTGFTAQDMIQDMVIIATDALHQYYPFREGLHLTNTMRNSITNRGRGAQKYLTVLSRRRICNDSEGNTFNIESASALDDVNNWAGFAEDPSDNINANITINDLIAEDEETTGKIVRFLVSDEIQNKFVAWVNIKYDIKATDITSAIINSGKNRTYLLAKFLNLDKEKLKSALRRLKLSEFNQTIKDFYKVA